MFPKVSIVISTYNRAHYLPEAVESALGQTYPHLEIIVVNDGSTDETEDVLAPYRKHIRYIKQENRGWAGAKNRGLEAATGELLSILDDDDRLRPEKVARQVEMFRQSPDLGICATGINLIDETGAITGSFIPAPIQPETQVIQLLRRCLVNQSSAMIHRRCYAHLGGLKQIHSDDYEYWLRASLHYPIRIVPELLTDYRLHSAQLTKTCRSEIREMSARVITDFVTQVPIEQIIPGLRSYPEGYALMGLILSEHQLFPLAQTYFERILPHPAGRFGLGLLHIHERNFTQATRDFEGVKAFDSPFASRVKEVLPLIERIQTIIAIPGISNLSPEVVELRKDLSHFQASIIQQLLSLARGKNREQPSPPLNSASDVIRRTSHESSGALAA